jgi:hypothetical protein
MLTLALWFLIGVSAVCAGMVTLACVLAGRTEKKRRPETLESRLRTDTRFGEERPALCGRFAGPSKDQPVSL